MCLFELVAVLCRIYITYLWEFVPTQPSLPPSTAALQRAAPSWIHPWLGGSTCPIFFSLPEREPSWCYSLYSLDFIHIILLVWEPCKCCVFQPGTGQGLLSLIIFLFMGWDATLMLVRILQVFYTSILHFLEHLTSEQAHFLFSWFFSRFYLFIYFWLLLRIAFFFLPNQCNFVFSSNFFSI